MFNEINNLLKKSRNIDINSLPKISKTYTLFKKYFNAKNKYLSNFNKIKMIKKEFYISNIYLIQNNLNKYNSSPKNIEKFSINRLINSTQCHLLVKYKENILISLKRELLKKYYNKDESKEKIPKFSKYYKNYLQYFCKPTFSDYHMNKIIHEYEEYQARNYYRSKVGKNKNKQKLIGNNSLKIIFNNSLRDSIDDIKFNSGEFIKSINYSQDDTIPENTLFQTIKISPENSIKSILTLFKYENREKSKRKKKTLKTIKNNIFNHKYKTRNYKFKPSLYENEIFEYMLNSGFNEDIESDKDKLKVCEIKGIPLRANFDFNLIKKRNQKENIIKKDNLSINKVSKHKNEDYRKNSFKKSRNKSKRFIKDEKYDKNYNKTYKINKTNIEKKNKGKTNNHSVSTSRIIKNSKHSSISTNFHFSPFQRKTITNNNSVKIFSAEQTTRNSDSNSTLKNRNNLVNGKRKCSLKKYGKLPIK